MSVPILKMDDPEHPLMKLIEKHKTSLLWCYNFLMSNGHPSGLGFILVDDPESPPLRIIPFTKDTLPNALRDHQLVEVLGPYAKDIVIEEGWLPILAKDNIGAGAARILLVRRKDIN